MYTRKKKKTTRRALLAAACAAAAGCVGEEGTEDGTEDSDSFSLTSLAFEDGETIPDEYTCEGENVSPPLRVENVPGEAETLALVVDDPDAPGGTYVHWLLWNIPADTEQIPQGVPHGPAVSELGGAEQGTNDADEVGYSGPCPPEGDGPHTYRFTLHAVDAELGVEAGAEREELEEALDGETVAEARLEGTYSR